MGLPSSRFQPQLLLVKSVSTWNKRFNRFATMKGPKRDQNWTLQEGPLLISRGSTYWPFFKHVSFARGPKNGPSAGWIRCLLEGPVLSPPLHLLPLRCSNVETHQHQTSQHWVGNKDLEQGRPLLRLQNSYQFKVQKTNPKTSLGHSCLDHDNLSLSIMLMQEVACFKRPATEKVQLCNRKSCRNGKKSFPQGEKAAAPMTKNIN